MNGQQLQAPQFGLRSGLPPVTDNPAAAGRAAPMPAAIRERLAVQRAACYNTSSLRCAQHPDVWGRGTR